MCKIDDEDERMDILSHGCYLFTKLTEQEQILVMDALLTLKMNFGETDAMQCAVAVLGTIMTDKINSQYMYEGGEA